MKQVMAEMYGNDDDEGLEKVTTASSSGGDYDDKCLSMAEQIKEMASEAGSDVQDVLAKISEKIKGNVAEPSDDANDNVEMATNAEEGVGGGKAPKKALIIAMLKKKNAVA